jgi:hypothetical protein
VKRLGIVLEKLKKRNKIFYVIDWILDIALIIFFLYVSVIVRNEISEKCLRNPYNLTNFTLNYTNFTGGIK